MREGTVKDLWRETGEEVKPSGRGASAGEWVSPCETFILFSQLFETLPPSLILPFASSLSPSYSSPPLRRPSHRSINLFPRQKGAWRRKGSNPSGIKWPVPLLLFFLKPELNANPAGTLAKKLHVYKRMLGAAHQPQPSEKLRDKGSSRLQNEGSCMGARVRGGANDEAGCRL